MKRKAFTLIEIMAVVIIVGLLAGLALPKLMRAMELQKIEVAKRHLEVIKSTLEMHKINRYPFVCDPLCENTEAINAAFEELDIHSSDFYFGVFQNVLGNSNRWMISAARMDDSYSLWIYSHDPDVFSCSGIGTRCADLGL